MTTEQAVRAARTSAVFRLPALVNEARKRRKTDDAIDDAIPPELELRLFNEITAGLIVVRRAAGRVRDEMRERK